MPRKKYDGSRKASENYINGKIKRLQNQFCIPLTLDEINHFYELQTVGDVDRYVRQIIVDKL